MAVTPAVAAHRLLCSTLLGCALGLGYDALDPLGQRHRTAADVLFSLATLWVWLYDCFALCRGDVRTVYVFALLAGLLLWESTAGKWIRPVFFMLWRFLGRLWRYFLLPWKKILDFSKILFASAEKWVTIKCTKICTSRKKRRKETHGTKKHPAQSSESGSSSRVQYP